MPLYFRKWLVLAYTHSFKIQAACMIWISLPLRILELYFSLSKYHYYTNEAQVSFSHNQYISHSLIFLGHPKVSIINYFYIWFRLISSRTWKLLEWFIEVSLLSCCCDSCTLWQSFSWLIIWRARTRTRLVRVCHSLIRMEILWGRPFMLHVGVDLKE